MPLYDYECCRKFDALVRYDARDTVSCVDCGKLAKRIENFQFSIGNATYVGADRFKGVEAATGIRGIENKRAAEAALKAVGAEPVDAYYRPPPPPPPKEVTLKELAPYLDGMPLYNEQVSE